MRHDLLSRLKNETAACHTRLENALDLMRDGLRRDEYIALLRRFRGYVAPWEDAVGARMPATLRPFFDERRKAPLLAADLVQLTGERANVASIPVNDLPRLGDLGSAFGSMYVMEGSTLGGQIISRALATQSWVPHGGLRSFNPYGAGTGAMWRGFGDLIEREGANRDAAKIVTGAQRTFDLLTQWLPA